MQQYSYTKLNSYNNRETFEASATEVNAFYDPNQNQIGEYDLIEFQKSDKISTTKIFLISNQELRQYIAAVKIL